MEPAGKGRGGDLGKTGLWSKLWAFWDLGLWASYLPPIFSCFIWCTASKLMVGLQGV